MSASLTCSYSSTTQLLTLSNMLNTAKSGALNFTVSGNRNPISTKTVSGIVIRTVGSDTGDIDVGSSSWSVPTPAAISSVSWTLTGSSVVSILTNMRFFFTLSFPVEANSIIEFTFPSDITITNDLSSYSGIGIFTSSGTFITKSSSVVKVSGSTGSTTASTSNIITFSSIRNPNKLKTTGTMTVTVYTSASESIATLSTGITLNASSMTSGSAGIVSITPDNSQVQSTLVSYTVIFNPGKPCLFVKVLNLFV
jgi:hypothetical protein